MTARTAHTHPPHPPGPAPSWSPGVYPSILMSTFYDLHTSAGATGLVVDFVEHFTMCYQITEVYSSCRCLYYKHAVDRCAAYGRPGHAVSKKTILVGYACAVHSNSSSYGSYAEPQSYSDSGYYSNHSTRDSYRQRR
ncbi:hypothetical protein GGR57DRAFT_504851 [Xylariaceae sp. FL1272]|nr:hypothetical protein GGR57DRAFT_504851 [Xylariaceae sp. FL1272]